MGSPINTENSPFESVLKAEGKHDSVNIKNNLYVSKIMSCFATRKELRSALSRYVTSLLFCDWLRSDDLRHRKPTAGTKANTSSQCKNVMFQL